MSNEELVSFIQDDINIAENLALIYEQNKRFIFKMANKYNGLVDVDDLIQEGYLGLHTAVFRYDPNMGVKFLTYAGHWVRQTMMRYIESSKTVRLPNYLYQSILQYEKLVDKFKVSYGCKPTDQEASYYLEMKEQQVTAIKKYRKLWSLASLDNPLEGSEELTIGETLPSDLSLEEEVLDDLTEAHLKEVLWGEVDKLEEEEGYVIRNRYQRRTTLNQLSEEMGVTRERVRQIEAKALRSLRRTKVTNKLKAFEVIESYAYRSGLESFKRTWTSSTEDAALKLLEKGL